MINKVRINLGEGNLIDGCDSVVIDFYGSPPFKPFRNFSSLTAAPELQEAYQEWYKLYTFYYTNCRSPEDEDDEDPDEMTSVGITRCGDDTTNQLASILNNLTDNLIQTFNDWLNIKNDNFRQIINQIPNILSLSIAIEVEDEQLQKLPWDWWTFVQNRDQAGISLGHLSNIHLGRKSRKKNQPEVRLLGILGDDKNIDTTQDRQEINIRNDIKAEFIQPKTRTELDEKMRSENWDILFYSGHSKQGLLYLKSSEYLDIDDLIFTLKTAISQGLSLVIFNCCLGLELARKIKELNLPAIIVMKEEVPNGVAQRFLKYLLDDFSRDIALDMALREAQRRLKQDRKIFPGAYFLATLVHNPSEELPQWDDLYRYTKQIVLNETVPPLKLFIKNCREYLHKCCREYLHKCNKRHSFLLPLIAIIISTLLVIIIRWVGLLQTPEFFFFDSLMRHKALEGTEQHLLVIKVTEYDKQKLKQDPLSDQTIINLIKKLQSYHPRVIGLDIYRDIPQGDKQQELMELIKQESSVIAICKVRENNNNDTPVPGENISRNVPLGSLGFSDFVPDSDGVIRRHLLQMNPLANSFCQAQYAFSFQIAQKYLNQEGIIAKSTPKSNFLQLGKTVFTRLIFPAGSYQKFEETQDYGYQIMLNYKTYKELDDIAPSNFISDVLTDKVNLSNIKDKIILLGYDDIEADGHKTPYPKLLPGVYIHAQMISQIINAAKGKRPLLKWLPWWGDLLFISISSFVGGLLIWWKGHSSINKKIMRKIIVLSLAISITLSLGFSYLFEQGYWLPLVPSVLSLLVTTLLGIFIYSLLANFPRNQR